MAPCRQGLRQRGRGPLARAALGQMQRRDGTFWRAGEQGRILKLTGLGVGSCAAGPGWSELI